MLVDTFGANVHAETHRGCTALHAAARSGHLSMMHFLLARGALADVNRQDAQGATPLHEAALKGAIWHIIVCEWETNVVHVQYVCDNGMYMRHHCDISMHVQYHCGSSMHVGISCDIFMHVICSYIISYCFHVICVHDCYNVLFNIYIHDCINHIPYQNSSCF